MQENLIIDTDILGEEYVYALRKVIEIRESRCKQYGNSYLSDDLLFLKYQIENKAKRLDLQIRRESGEEILIDSSVALDSAIDAANYALFAVAKLLNTNI